MPSGNFKTESSEKKTSCSRAVGKCSMRLTDSLLHWSVRVKRKLSQKTKLLTYQSICVYCCHLDPTLHELMKIDRGMDVISWKQKLGN